MDCDERFTKAFEVAILHYDGADDEEPEGIPTYDNTFHTGIVNITIQLNSINSFYTVLMFIITNAIIYIR